MLDELGLVHMNGRIYDARIGRFLSGDVVVQFKGDLQSYNRYTYVRNNPLRVFDPTGYSESGLSWWQQVVSVFLPDTFDAWMTGNQDQLNDQLLYDRTDAEQLLRDATVELVETTGETFEILYEGVRTLNELTPAGPALAVAELVTGREMGLPEGQEVSRVESASGLAAGAVAAPVRFLKRIAGKVFDLLADSKIFTRNITDVVAQPHKNSLDFVGETHVYRIKGPDGTTYKIGESAQGVRVSDEASRRAEQQVRQLQRETGQNFESEIRRIFPDKASARDYERRLIERFRRMFGENTLPGNKTNR